MDNCTKSIIAAILCATILCAIMVFAINFTIAALITAETYTNAPDCNGTLPQGAGICKWSNHTWIVCKNATGYEADEHLRKMAWCEPIEFYDVRT